MSYKSYKLIDSKYMMALIHGTAICMYTIHFGLIRLHNPFIIMYAAPLLSRNISCIRLDGTNFNFTVDVVHTGAGNDATLTLAKIHFREQLSDSNFISHFADVPLMRQVDPRSWHGNLFNDQIEELTKIIEFKVAVTNNLGHVTNTTTVFSEYGIFFFNVTDSFPVHTHT